MELVHWYETQEAAKIREHANTATVAELRKAMGALGIVPASVPSGERGVWRACANKDALVRTLIASVDQGFNKYPVLDTATYSTPDTGNKILDGLREFMEAQTAKLDPDAIRTLIQDEIARLEPAKSITEFRCADFSMEFTDTPHKSARRLILALQAKRNVWIYGPPGTGKTHTAEVMAAKLNLPFYPVSCGPDTLKHDLFGFQGPGGYVSTVFRQAFEHGGIFVADEIDRANPAVLTQLNAATSNKWCSFPDGIVEAHPDFLVVACANTTGNGGTQYAGARKVDSTTLDRFVLVEWGYDENIERSLYPLPKWTEFVHAVRGAVKALQIDMVVSARAIINGAELFKVGADFQDVLDMAIYKGLGQDAIYRIENHLTQNTTCSMAEWASIVTDEINAYR